MYALPALTTQTSLVLPGYHGDPEPQSNDVGDPLSGRSSKRSGQGKGVAACVMCACSRWRWLCHCVTSAICHPSVLSPSLYHLSPITVPSVTRHSTICHPHSMTSLSQPLSPDDSKKLFSKFKKLMSSNTSETATFGVALEVCPLSETHPFVPKVMDLCITEIEQRGLQCEGLYRWVG